MPQRARSQNKRWQRRVMLLFKRVCLCAAALLFIAWGLTVLLRPFLMNQDVVSEIRRLQTEVAAVEAEKQRLRQRIQVLNTPKGIAVEARRQGWIRPGEILIQVVPPPPQDAIADATPGHEPPNAAVPPNAGIRQDGGMLRQTYHLASRALARFRREPPSAPNVPSEEALAPP